ncbi:MAG: DUF4097 family beta strand repeat-containing protein [bacterium]
MLKSVCKTALLFFGLVSTVFSQGTVDGRFDVGNGGRLILNLDKIGGTIAIEGWEQARVEIKGETYGQGWDKDCGLSMRGDNTEVAVGPDCGYPAKRDEYRRAKVSLKIKVPKKFDIKLEADAETTISQVEGRMDIAIGNADLDLSWIYGRADIHTANGRIYITDCKLDGNISNTNGRLTIEKSSVQGEVRTTNSSMELSDAPYGIALGSTNGTIRIGSAKEFVRARTTNGSVRIGELDGRLEVETVNGNVEAKMIGNGANGGHDIDLETLNGDIELLLPDDFSMNVDIVVTERNSRKRSRRYTIASDFNISVDTVELGRDDYEVRGKGSVRGGKNKVYVRAVNGDVHLRKARGEL